MKTIVPGNAARASSRTSREARSRCFVGSPTQGGAVATLDAAVDAGVHDVAAVRLVDALERGHAAAGPRRLGEREADHARLALDLDAVDAIEHLHPALDLPGLARLVSEALDEALDLGDTLGLVPCLRLEQLAARLSLDEILVVVTGIDGEPRRRQLGDRG